MSRHIVSPAAREDVKDIYRYVLQRKPSAARRLRDGFFKTFRMLAGQPFFGQECPNLRPGLRAFVVGNYVIFYVPTKRGIEIERVLHGARDIETLF